MTYSPPQAAPLTTHTTDRLSLGLATPARLRIIGNFSQAVRDLHFLVPGSFALLQPAPRPSSSSNGDHSDETGYSGSSGVPRYLGQGP